MKRRNAIKKMIVSIAGLFGLSTVVEAKKWTPNKACLKIRKTAIGEVYFIEFPLEQYEIAIATIRSLSNDLYARKLKSYSAKFSPEGHCVVEWSPNMYV